MVGFVCLDLNSASCLVLYQRIPALVISKSVGQIIGEQNCVGGFLLLNCVLMLRQGVQSRRNNVHGYTVMLSFMIQLEEPAGTWWRCLSL